MRGEVAHLRRKVELAGEPGTDAVRIARSDIDRLGRHERAHMGGHELLRQAVGLAGTEQDPVACPNR